MMHGKSRILSHLAFGLLLLLLAGAGCTREERRPTGSVTIHFSTSSVQTRALGDGNVADGGGIATTIDNGVYYPDLVILVYNSSNVLKGIYPDTSADPTSSLNTSLTSNPATAVSIKFTGLGQGTYSVYAVANTSGLWMNSAPSWSSLTPSQLQALCFDSLSGSNTPTVANGGRMPLSAKASLSVNENNNGSLNLELKRCVAKVDVTFRNLTGKALSIQERYIDDDDDVSTPDVALPIVSISPMNPEQGYLFAPQSASDYVSGGDRALLLSSSTALSMAATDDSSTPNVDETRVTVGPLYVFPSEANRYLCDIHFRFSLGVGSPEDVSFTNLPVHDNTSTDITELLRNQHLKIVITISEGTDISFNFEVAQWTPIENEVEFT